MEDRRIPSPRILSEAARRFGMIATDLQLVRYVQNAVYTFQHNGTTYFLRLTDGNRTASEEIAGELDWLRHLAVKGLPVCQPVPSTRGRLFERVSATEQSFLVVCFAKAPGNPITKDDLKPALYESLGQLLGKLHVASRDYRASGADVRRPKWYCTHGLTRDLDCLPQDQAEVRRNIEKLVASLRSLPQDHGSYGLIHGDINFSSCHLDNDQLHLFDFDHCQYGYLVQDIATAVYECAIHVPDGGAERVARFWPTFWAGYHKEDPLDPKWLERVPDFVRLRDAWIYVHFHRVHNMPHLMAREERIRRDFETWRQRIEAGQCPVQVTFC